MLGGRKDRKDRKSSYTKVVGVEGVYSYVYFFQMVITQPSRQSGTLTLTFEFSCTLRQSKNTTTNHREDITAFDDIVFFLI